MIHLRRWGPLLAALLTLAVVPRLWLGRQADAWLDHDLALQDAYARGLIRWVETQPKTQLFNTGSSRFDGQSAIAFYQMTLLALGQIALEHPELRDDYLPTMRVAAERLAAPGTLTYAAQRYGRHASQGMDPGEGHAYAGYIALGLGMLRALEPETPTARVHERLSRAFAQRLWASKTGLIETYPDETWPPDVAAVAGAVGLWLQVTGQDRKAEVASWSERFARCSVDPTGYLIQRVESGTCTPVDAPRGSGTAIGAYFLSFIDPALARRLTLALRETGRTTFLGFGGIREYAPGHSGQGDVNAGPIVLGVSVGGTGFGLGAAAAAGDRGLYTELYRTANLFGVSAVRDGQGTFVTGGALGDALLLAMLTARTP